MYLYVYSSASACIRHENQLGKCSATISKSVLSHHIKQFSEKLIVAAISWGILFHSLFFRHQTKCKNSNGLYIVNKRRSNKPTMNYYADPFPPVELIQ